MTEESSNIFFDLTELRKQWEALATADTLHMLPPEALIASIKDLANELLKRTESDITQVADDLSEAIRLTVEYIGNDLLPAKEGYSWFDALDKWYPEKTQPFIDNPIHFASNRWVSSADNVNPAFINLDDPNTDLLYEHESAYRYDKAVSDAKLADEEEKIFIGSHRLKLDDTAFTITVVTCKRCGCLVSDRVAHEQTGHAGLIPRPEEL